MKTKFTCLALTFLVAGGSALAGTADDFDEAVIKGKQLVEEGVSKFDEKTLISARSHFERLLQNDEMRWLTQYYIGYTDYRLALYYQMRNNKDLRVRHLDEGIEMINACLEKKEKFADAHGVLSALLGLKVGADPSLGMTLGMEIFTAMGEAQEYGRDNPRVAMFSAISAYYTPEQFGGSKTKAANEIARAVKLFKTEKLADKRLPDWGRGEALAWQAQFYVESGELDLARKSLDSALEIDPQSGFAFSVQQALRKKISEK